MFTKILNKVRTRAEVYHLLGEVDLILTSLYEKGDKGFESTMASGIRSWVSEMISSELPKSKKKPEYYLKLMKTYLETLPSINLTLGFEPNSMALDKFVSYLRESTGKDIVLDIEEDKLILGGAIISYNGLYKDFSISRVLNESQSKIKDIVQQKMNTPSLKH